MNDAQRSVLKKLNGRQWVDLVGLDDEKQHLHSLLTSTVRNGEGNSCMILGPRATGKTTLIQTTLDELEKDYSGQFLRVNLSGFVQLDDKMALREISRQLDSVINDESTTIQERSMTHTLFQILSTFQQSKGKMAVVFVLEELDKFARHPRQTLLYNLLELSQTANIGIAVIGVSCRMTTREMLEKRVLSRFSQRVYQIKRPATLDEFWDVAKINLQANHDDEWNNSIEEMYNNKPGPLRDLVEFIFYTTKDYRQLNNAMIEPVARADPFIDPRLIKPPVPMSNTALFVEGLAELELALLICATRMEFKHDTDTINFNIVYDEYAACANKLNLERKMATSGLTNSGKTMLGRYRVWSKESALSAWERLEFMQLLIPQGDMVKVDIGLMEIGEIIGLNHTLHSWTRV